MRGIWSGGLLRMTALAVAVVLAATAGVVVAGSAANAAPQPGSVYVTDFSELVFQAGPGATNDLVVRPTATGYEIEDLSNPVVLDTARARGCRQATPRKVACPDLRQGALRVHAR
jgi:hypothetical protein